MTTTMTITIMTTTMATIARMIVNDYGYDGDDCNREDEDDDCNDDGDDDCEWSWLYDGDDCNDDDDDDEDAFFSEPSMV